MKQVLIHKNPLIKEMSGNLLTICTSENFLPILSLDAGFNWFTIPFQCLSDKESLFAVANLTPNIASKGVMITSVAIKEKEIEVYMWSQSTFKLQNGEPLMTLAFVDTCLFKQVEPNPDVKIVGETKSVLKIDRKPQQKRKPRKKTTRKSQKKA